MAAALFPPVAAFACPALAAFADRSDRADDPPVLCDPPDCRLFAAPLSGMVPVCGISESGLDKLIKASYSLLGLISFLTAGKQEVRAWTIKEGTKAPQAAGKIHSDFERGFIKAEVISYNDLITYGSTAAAKDKGLVRLEGKEYVVQDGDVILFRFNV